MADSNIFNYNINDGFLWSEVNLKGEKKYFVEGYASTIDEDKSGEILDMTAQQDILNQIQSENITMDVEHEEWYDASGKLLTKPKNEKIPVARVVNAELRPRGVWVKAQINTNLRSFQELWGSIKDGFLKAFSVAFYPVHKVGGVIKHLNLVNITLTGSPVNPNATFIATMKNAAAWLDSQELKAEFKPKIDNPADVPGIDNPADKVPIKNTKMTEVKSEETKMSKCDKCEKEFKDEEALKEHYEKVHSKKEEPTTKSEDKDADDKKEKPKVKAETEVDMLVELKSLRTEIASLKAELEKPVMKAIVEEKMPQEKPIIKNISPLNLVG